MHKETVHQSNLHRCPALDQIEKPCVHMPNALNYPLDPQCIVRVGNRTITAFPALNIWRNGPYISGHLAFLFQIEF